MRGEALQITRTGCGVHHGYWKRRNARGAGLSRTMGFGLWGRAGAGEMALLTATPRAGAALGMSCNAPKGPCEKRLADVIGNAVHNKNEKFKLRNYRVVSHFD